MTLVDLDRAWSKAAYGLERDEIPRAVAFASHGILADEIFEVPDASSDPRFCDNPHVAGQPGIRFFAGVPLRTSEGFALGTIGVMDRRPRTLAAAQRDALRAVAAALVEQLEQRRTMLRLFDTSHSELYHVDLETQRIVFASDAARRNLGYEPEELREAPLEALLPRLAIEGRLAQRLAELRAHPGRRLALRTVVRRKDGTTYPVDLHVELVPGRGHELALVVARDVTESEQAQERINLLSAAIESAQDAIFIARLDPDPLVAPTIVYANEAYLRQKGVRLEQVVGRRVSQFHGPLTETERLIEIRREVLAGRATRGEYITYRADGSTYYCESTARPLVSDEGRATHFVVVQRDVTETVLRGAELAMQNERLTQVTSIARTLFAALEPSVLVEALLGGVRELIGGSAHLYAPRPRGGFVETRDLSPSEGGRLGDGFVTLAARSDVCVLDEPERRAAVKIPGSADGIAYILEARRETRLGSADVFALGLLAQYFAVAARNVELYRELAARRDAVVELNQVKNDLIAMMAHDFKGPLTTIVGFADVLAEDERFDADARQYLGMISSSAMRLASLATDTLTLSRLEQNEFSLSCEEVDLAALVRDVVRVFSVTRAIDVRVGAGKHIVTADPARIRQVIENLVGNAIKYSPGGEPVEVAVRSRGENVEIVVRDRGIGIPESERAKLFGRFARASNARALGIGGTGFGLYLSRTIVELHGGRIEVDSTEGHGSTFRIILPVESGARARGARRIALLDVEGDARSYIAQAMRDDGYAVTVATSGEELLRLVDEGAYDAALVDGERLRGAARSFVRRIGGRIPLVRIGLHAPGDDDGWDAFVTKPFLMKDLYGALDAAIDHANGGRSSAPVNAAGSSTTASAPASVDGSFPPHSTATQARPARWADSTS
jgi:PAS domain S-box-containing protein